jgi:hypothetical protein
MTGNDRDHMPTDWDALVDRSPNPASQRSDQTGDDRENPPSALTLMAASWADLVSMLAVCTAALAAILAIGERPALPAFAWAVALALVWWLFAATILIVVRQATPGMLLAGVSFTDSVAPERVGWVLAAAFIGVATLGLSGGLGGERSILCRAAASTVVTAPLESSSRFP